MQSVGGHTLSLVQHRGRCKGVCGRIRVCGLLAIVARFPSGVWLGGTISCVLLHAVRDMAEKRMCFV